MTAIAASVLAGILVCWGARDYAAEVFRREADPRLAAWALWTCASGIAAAGAVQARSWPSAALCGVNAVTCAVILAAGLARGNREIGWPDAAGCAAGGAGLALLAVALLRPGTVPVTAALTAAVVTDLAAVAPMLANAGRGEETPGAYLKFAAAGAVVLAAAVLDPAYRQAGGLLFPAYLAAADLAMAVAAAAGRRRAAARLSVSWPSCPGS